MIANGKVSESMEEEFFALMSGTGDKMCYQEKSLICLSQEECERQKVQQTVMSDEKVSGDIHEMPVIENSENYFIIESTYFP